MTKHEDIPTTDPAQIEQLIERIKQNKLEQADTQLLERILRTFLSLISLLQHKNASLKRLKRMIFGPKTEKRKAGRSKPAAQTENQRSAQPEHQPADRAAQRRSGTASESGASPPANQPPKRPATGEGKLPPTRARR